MTLLNAIYPARPFGGRQFDRVQPCKIGAISKSDDLFVGEVDDDALIDLIRQRNVQALEELYERYHRIAMAVAFRVLADRCRSEDILQEAFLAVWRQPETYRTERGSVRTWLLSIVRHRAIDLTRSRSFKREMLSLDQISHEPRTLDTWTRVCDRLDRECIRSAIAELPKEQSESILLAYFGGYKQSEISEIMGVPLGTVKGRIRLGMQKLRDLLNEPVHQYKEESIPES